MRLVPIRTGGTRLARGYVFRGESWTSFMGCPIGCFLVEGAAGGPILIDTGLRGPGGASLPDALRARGVAPADVTDVVMTHLHLDHTGWMRSLEHATFHIARAEWDAARSLLGLKDGYVRLQLPSADRVRFAAEGELLGMRLVATPGHTAGHMSVVVPDDDGPTFVLGDAVYTLRSLEEDVLPWRTWDDGASRASMARVRAVAAEHPGIRLIPTHDAMVWRSDDFRAAASS